MTLSQFCKAYGLNKTTVYQDCLRLNIPTSDGLSDESIEILLSEYRAEFGEVLEPETQEVFPTEIIPDGFFKTSSLEAVNRREIELPDTFDPAVLIQQFDGVMGNVTDTARLVQIAEAAIESVTNAMDAKIQAQREALNQSEKDSKRLESVVSTAFVDLKVKSLESKMIAENQSKQTADAEAIFNQLMGLGKPTDG